MQDIVEKIYTLWSKETPYVCGMYAIHDPEADEWQLGMFFPEDGKCSKAFRLYAAAVWAACGNQKTLFERCFRDAEVEKERISETPTQLTPNEAYDVRVKEMIDEARDFETQLQVLGCQGMMAFEYVDHDDFAQRLWVTHEFPDEAPASQIHAHIQQVLHALLDTPYCVLETI